MCTSEKSQNNLAGYREHILKDTRYINLQGIPLPSDRYGRRISMHIPLDRVYIRIQAIEEKQSLAQQRAEERQLEKGQRPEYEHRRKGYFDYIHELGEHLYRQDQIYQKTKRPEAVDPLEALKKHKRMVILGAPGCGKSTLLRYVARKAVQDNINIPILIPLREYAAVLARDEAIPLDDFALKQMSKGNENLHRSLKDAIEAGHVIWLLDALDEAQPWGEKITRQISHLKGSLIITSRPIGYTNVGLENLTHFEFLPLVSDHIDQFLSDWFGIIAEKLDEGPDWIEDRKARFSDQLAKRPRIQPLTHNPLLLTFLVILTGTYEWQDLPDRRAQLYKRYVEELLSRWEYERKGKDHEGESVFTLGPLTGKEAKNCALKGFYYLGWYMHLLYYGGEPETIPTREVIISAVAGYVSEKYRNQSNEIADGIVRFWMEAGILSVWNLEGNEYLTFRHLTFQEYAASWGLAEIWRRDPGKAWEFLRPRLHHYAWREPILLLAGMLEKQYINELARHILRGKSHYERVLHRDLRLTTALLGEGAPLDQKLRKSVIQRLFKSIWYYYLKIGITLLFTYVIGLLIIIFVLPLKWFIILGISILWTLAWYRSFVIQVIPQIQNILALRFVYGNILHGKILLTDILWILLKYPKLYHT